MIRLPSTLLKTAALAALLLLAPAAYAQNNNGGNNNGGNNNGGNNNDHNNHNTSKQARMRAKAEEINLVLLEPDVDLWKLRELALSDGGLVATESSRALLDLAADGAGETLD